MNVELTTPEEVVMRDEHFAKVCELINDALKNNTLVDNGDGWGQCIEVHANYDEWMEDWIKLIYARAGWDNISFKYIGRILFLVRL